MYSGCVGVVLLLCSVVIFGFLYLVYVCFFFSCGVRVCVFLGLEAFVFFFFFFL